MHLALTDSPKASHPGPTMRILSRDAWGALDAETRSTSAVRRFGASSAARVTERMAKNLGIEFKDNSYVWTLSTDAEDRYRDVIQVDGWTWKNYLEGGSPVLWGHDGSIPPIGTMLTLWKETGRSPGKNRLRGVRHFHQQTELSREISLLVANDILRASSVGFLPTDVEDRLEESRWIGYNFTKADLLEDSVVGIPANPDALIGVKSMLDGAYRAEMERVSEEADLGDRAREAAKKAAHLLGTQRSTVSVDYDLIREIVRQELRTLAGTESPKPETESVPASVDEAVLEIEDEDSIALELLDGSGTDA